MPTEETYTLTSFDVRTANLRAINSMTKYPSIPTYHALDPRNGSLLDETIPFVGPVLGTEKVDGTNGRIITLPDGTYLIGSREDLLYAQGDLIGDKSLGIVDALKPIAESLPAIGDLIRVYYLEVYGAGIGQAWKQYASKKDLGGARLFDVVEVANYDEVLGWERDRIASWRQHGGQPFLAEGPLMQAAVEARLDWVPRLFSLDASEVPTDIEKMRAFLGEHLPTSLVSLDAGAGGRGEGIVLRSPNRSLIAKARFQDYDRTLKRRK